ncbi:hypothetical protein SELMODRAFT_407498 [Selaginella moellendorffii]|uniref:Uncharacterized protein n=1 Tax=Selaginella moellendorffii TaxID=88036 RepID=D8R5T4_SELML|nr:hypothetical protein SELMODRAFT_407498 [Selaginella moellendorffii]
MNVESVHAFVSTLTSTGLQTDWNAYHIQNQHPKKRFDTKTPEETWISLESWLPGEEWVPINPFCSMFFSCMDLRLGMSREARAKKFFRILSSKTSRDADMDTSTSSTTITPTGAIGDNKARVHGGIHLEELELEI